MNIDQKISYLTHIIEMLKKSYFSIDSNIHDGSILTSLDSTVILKNLETDSRVGYFSNQEEDIDGESID